MDEDNQLAMLEMDASSRLNSTQANTLPRAHKGKPGCGLEYSSFVRLYKVAYPGTLQRTTVFRCAFSCDC